jgi:hypothetical protein
MALQANIPLPGGITHADGYVRVIDSRVCKKDGESDWFMMVGVAAYKDADARAAKVRLTSPEVDQFKFAYSVDGGASPADAYAKLKTLDLFADATNV